MANNKSISVSFYRPEKNYALNNPTGAPLSRRDAYFLVKLAKIHKKREQLRDALESNNILKIC